MVFFWKKKGEIYHHAAETKEAAMQAARLMDGLTGEPIAEVTDAEFESAGCLARLFDGELVLGKTDAENLGEQNAGRIRVLKRRLAETDYIAVKIAESAATASEYAGKLAERQAWRAEIQKLESV